MYQEPFSNFFKQFRRTSFCFFVQYKQENGGELMKKYFLYDEHLGIEIPHLQEDWEDIPEKMQHAILLKWEQVRGKIPDRIKEIEHYINAKQHHLNNEEDFEISCKLNSEIADLASIINDLWLWYRLTQNVSEGKAHQ
ncbi:conserved hypothetical protein [[Bacillus thuringiensis] serovar konkukian str. 97-27]|nr:conserved hypothetical protein [[Bacillus thuringiensis] serovar konkukian str. 97-27]